MINQNDMSKWIAANEGGAVELSIAEIKEVQRQALMFLAHCSATEVLQLLNKFRDGEL